MHLVITDHGITPIIGIDSIDLDTQISLWIWCLCMKRIEDVVLEYQWDLWNMTAVSYEALLEYLAVKMEVHQQGRRRGVCNLEL